MERLRIIPIRPNPKRKKKTKKRAKRKAVPRAHGYVVQGWKYGSPGHFVYADSRGNFRSNRAGAKRYSDLSDAAAGMRSAGRKKPDGLSWVQVVPA